MDLEADFLLNITEMHIILWNFKPWKESLKLPNFPIFSIFELFASDVPSFWCAQEKSIHFLCLFFVLQKKRLFFFSRLAADCGGVRQILTHSEEMTKHQLPALR